MSVMPGAKAASSAATRRQFLTLAAMTFGASILAACSSAPAPSPTPAPVAPVPTAAAPPTPAATAAPQAAGSVTLQFFYPVEVGGPITKIIDGYMSTFNQANPGITVTSVFAGSYQDTLTKIQTVLDGGGQPPDVAVLLSTDMNSLIDADSILPLDDQIKTAPAGYADDFYPAFMLNSRFKGSTWGIPFQRSTPVLYYNVNHFKEVGLAEKGPANWADQVAAAKKLLKDGGARWGLQIPSDGFPYWLFQGIVLGNGVNVVGDAANQVTFNTQAVGEALQAMVNLSKSDKVMVEGVVAWATTPNDFTGGKVSMMWHTTGSLTNVLKQAQFPVGVGFLPGLKQNGAPTGGGNLFTFKKTPAEKRAGAWKLTQFLSSPDQEAQWSIDTGYVAPRKAAYETAAMKAYAEKTPQALVARDQLQFAGKELSGHNGAQLQQILGLAVQSAILGKKDPKQALDDAQKEAEKILSQFKD